MTNDDPGPQPAAAPTPGSHPRRARTAGLVLLGLLASLVLAAGAVVAVRDGEALPGTTVAGVDVGGLAPADIRSRLRDTVEARTTGVLQVVAEELFFTLDRERLAVAVDLDQTAERAVRAGRENGVARLLGPLLGRGEPLDLTASVAGEPLRERVEAIAAVVDREPHPGGIAVTGVTVTPVPPSEGRELRRDDAVRDLTEALLAGRQEPLVLPVRTVEPDTTLADVDAVVERAATLLAGPLRLTAPEATLEVAPQELAPLLRTQLSDDAGLELLVDRVQLAELVSGEAARIDRAPRQAGFDVPQPATVDTQGDLTWTPRPAQVSVRPGAPGLTVHQEAAVDVLEALVRVGEREGPLPVQVTAPAFTGQDATEAGVTSLLGTFTTYFRAGQPRARNIRRIAEAVDGSYVPPGQRFSLNETAGRRTRAKGYVADGAIIDGELVDQVGGGVSQFATTIFNAAFFAGLPIEEHKPHSFYISRYPAGRESTVNFGTIDVRFRNDTDNGLVVKTWSTSRSVTAAVYGDNGGRRVTSTSGPRRPRPGGGFTVTVTRTIGGGDGRGDRRVFRAVYDPPPD